MDVTSNDNYFENYCRLLEKVEQFTARVMCTYHGQIVCRYGCSDCCRQDLHLFPVEFHYLKHGLEKGIADVQTMLKREHQQGTCFLLREEACALYHYRPIICRTHGLPLLITDGETQWRDCCSRNFAGHPLETLPPDDLLHLERLNMMLAGVNMQYCSRAHIDPGTRMPVSELAGQPENRSDKA